MHLSLHNDTRRINSRTLTFKFPYYILTLYQITVYGFTKFHNFVNNTLNDKIYSNDIPPCYLHIKIWQVRDVLH